MKDEDLLRYIDGEMSPREAREVEAELAASGDARRKLAALRQLQELVAARIEIEAEESAPRLRGMWSRVAAGIEATPRPGLLSRLRDWFDANRGYVATGALAAAAGALVMVWLRPQRHNPGETQEPQPIVVAGTPAEVESLEVPDGTGTIFQIPSDNKNEPTTTVIWLSPNEAEGPI